ncbi:hypothetical protein SDRG_13229 [Saprolegnia diclina VS20]|uniref:Uncharacterized protein n=1 Tax=Saprolegnia diclina (strain VS20) TaxID=1156394 RepID=T0RA95_SAPDV|nr:hypothetical protein SDRG_13229 [Saprolegnia diclina VS20]EQC29073.1 hypothetical protein SDRG_13229 [Saprolegnia diclina VS20]|eukprot:XP_008617532.1 hypothetical protein SDRG_13229 [Saprolegnia diclina VS20]
MDVDAVQDAWSQRRAETRGPTVLIAGPTDAGKSSLSRALLWHALQDRPEDGVAFVDLDIGQGEISIPGTIGATVLTRASLPDEDDLLDFGHSHNYPLAFHGRKMQYFVGDANLSAVPGAFKHYTSALATSLAQRHTADPELNGAVINTCGWVDDLGYQLLLHAVRAFAVDILVVLGSHSVYDQLLQDAPPSTTLFNLPRAAGAVRRSGPTRRAARDQRLQRYFAPQGEWTYVEVDAASIVFHRVRDKDPRGRGRAKLLLAKESILADRWLHQVVALVRPPPPTLARDDATQYLLRAPAIGFVAIHAIDKQAKTVTLVAPVGGPLPSKHLLAGSNVELLP